MTRPTRRWEPRKTTNLKERMGAAHDAFGIIGAGLRDIAEGVR